QPLPVPKAAQVLQRDQTGDSAYWKSFESPVIIKEFATVNSLCFSPAAPHDLIVASSSRVQIYDRSTCELKKSIARFKHTVLSAETRQDGRVLLAADESGQLQLFDLSSRTILRTLRGHTGAVHRARFVPSSSLVASCSDDRTVRVWDIPSERTLSTFTDHTDYVRALDVCPTNPNLLVTGSYDHSLKVFDLRAGKCTLSVNHADPIEDVLAFTSGTMFAVAGGPTITMYDGLMNGSEICSLDNFQKTVTSLTFDSTRTKLLTSSLDRQVKIFNLATFECTFTANYPMPVLRVALDPTETRLVAGMSGGTLDIRRR
ncbi:WD40-repeat-containing domain protein, partial [Dimargaris cristalligena]